MTNNVHLTTGKGRLKPLSCIEVVHASRSPEKKVRVL